MKINEVARTLKTLSNDLGEIVPPEVIDRVLESMGLQVRRSSVRGFFGGTGIFLAGVVIGGAAALLLAPKGGLEIRSDLEDKLDSVIEKLKGMVGSKTETAEDETASTKSATSTTGAKTEKSDKPNQSGTRGTVHHS